jgi:hypothetical protein
MQNGRCCDVRTSQEVVTEFLTVEGSSPIEIHRRLRSVYGEDDIMLADTLGPSF